MKFFLLTGAHRPAVFSSIHMKTIILILAARLTMGKGYHNQAEQNPQTTATRQ